MKKVDESTIKPLTVDVVKDQMLTAVNLYEDIQKVRIAMCNRICSYYHLREKDIDSKADDNTEIDDDVIRGYTKEYNKILIRMKSGEKKRTVDTIIKTSDDLEYIKSKYDYLLMQSYVNLLSNEEDAAKLVDNVVKQHPMWNGFFKDVKGVGTTIAGRVLAKLDIHSARHVSSFWSYCGVGTVVDENGERVAATRKVTVMKEYVDKHGEVREKKSITYNPKMQALICYNMVGSIIRTGQGSKYAKCYYDYKNRYNNREDLKEISNLRLHRMAVRQVAKSVLRDLWVTWRTYEGYTISAPYEVEYLGRAEHEYNEYHVRKFLSNDNQK